MSTSPPTPTPLDRARGKAYTRLLPLLFLSYVVAYVDRVNVGFAKLNMQQDLAPLGFTEAAFGFGMGVFFIGYLLLEIPGTLLVERWSARKWISRIMISWGFIAAMTSFVHYRVPFFTDLAGVGARATATAIAAPLAASGIPGVADLAASAVHSLRGAGGAYVFQFVAVRFMLGLAEAGFYPGVIVYLTHWFPRRDRTKALAYFFIGTPIAQIIGPLISNQLMGIGTDGHARLLGMVGWQWVFVVWGLPAIVLGVLVLAYLTDKPSQARWLTDEERDALEDVLRREKLEQKAHTGGHTSVGRALADRKVLLLASAYFFVVTGNYGVELYMASILKDWYGLVVNKVTYMIIIPPIGSLFGQILVGWNSDRTGERRLHASLPILVGAAALMVAPASEGTLWVTIVLFTVAMTGLKAYLPAFWSLPSLLMTETAAAASIGMINSFGNLGGWVGPTVIGAVKQHTGSYRNGLWFLASSMTVSAVIILALGIGRRPRPETEAAMIDPLADALHEPV